MAPRRPEPCRVCNSENSKYSCPSCLIPYCSVTCFKEHKTSSCSSAKTAHSSLDESGSAATVFHDRHLERRAVEEDLPDDRPLRPLTSLRWPYVPEESVYLDPLKRDDPKPLQLHQYEAIATSSAVRSALSTKPSLQALLQNLDKLRGTEREEALERLLGVTNTRKTQSGGYRRREAVPEPRESEEDAKALKQLAEAIEEAVRGEKRDVLGLDWTDDG